MRVARQELIAPAALGVILAAQAVLLSRLVHTRTWYDEGVYLLSADLLRHGQSVAEIFTPQPPGFYRLLEGLGALVGFSVGGMRWGIIVCAMAASAALYTLGRRLFGTLAGLTAAGMLVIAPPLPIYGARVVGDVPAAALAMIALAFVAARKPTLAGGAFGAAILVKFTAFTVAPAVVAMLFVQERSLRPMLRAAAGFAAVIAVVALVELGSIGSIWSDAVSYHESARATSDGLHNAHELREFFEPRTPFFWLLVAGILSTVRTWRTVWPLWLWAAAAALFVLLHTPLHENHLLILPFAFATPAGVALGGALMQLRRDVAVVAIASVALAGAAGWVQQLHRVDAEEQPEDASRLWAAGVVEHRTAPDELIVSDQPLVPLLAERRVPGDLVDIAKLRFDTGSLTDERVLATIDSERVAAVVAGRALLERPRLLEGLDKRFPRRVEQSGVRLFLRS